ncbi:hypothetical protein VM1G_05832 [Cytospora mali]|uniref:IQ domain-containing protein IQM6 n=1 Tax=Cytospora mali TaxID=578113 RepID=A0A194W2N4_CYTMA|nr:hypothetical protein VM1G_05832 [Valsa mali]
MTEETHLQTHAPSETKTSSVVSPHENPGPANHPLPTPPHTPSSLGQTKINGLDKEDKYFSNMHGQSGQDTAATPPKRSKKEYMDSLVPPSSEEISRISQVQLAREQQEKRKSRERAKEQRRSMEVSRSSLDLESTTKSRRSSIFSRHKKTDSTAQSPPRSKSVTAAAVASAKADGTLHGVDDIPQHRAATLIQRTYRGYRTRREMKGLGLDADTRWTHAMRELQFREMTKPRARSEDGPTQALANATDRDMSSAKKLSPARYNWRKAAVIAKRAGADMDDDSTSISSDSDSDADSGLLTPEKRKAAHQKREEAKVKRRNNARMMGLQYFLEMVDLKHRYGSNLRQYHEQWKNNSDTSENFFYWLDYGQGRNVELATCPRERLERERVRYLSREERQYYLAMVDSEGRLCWAKNGQRIDTTEKWKDSIHGIVPSDDPTPPFRPTSTDPNQPKLLPSDSSGGGSTSIASGASESELEAARAAKYASPGFTDAKGVKKVTHISASTIFNTLLRKSVRKNTWIFVADTSFRLYVGIKDSGAFQHSSFLQGSRISAAGLIKIKNGRLTSLSPLSGHYRPPASNFRAFVRSLKEEGVDMTHVSISKSYAVLVGLEMYVQTRQKGKKFLQKATHKKDKVIHPEEVQKREEAAKDKSQSAEKERQFLEKQAQEDSKLREENRAAMKVMQRLGVNPTVPEGQRGEMESERPSKAEGGLPMPTVEEGKTTT